MHKLSRAGFLVRLCVVSVYTFINFKTALELFAFTMFSRNVLLFLLFFFIGRTKSGAESSEGEFVTIRSRVTTRHNSCRSVVFEKSGRGSGNFLNHYNAHRFFDASFLERATISRNSPHAFNNY